MKLVGMNYRNAWGKAVDDNDASVDRLLRQGESPDSKLARLAFGSYKLECFLEGLCTKYATAWLSLSPLEAGRLYLLNKHHWAPDTLKQVQKSDFVALLHEELIETPMTEAEFEPVKDWCADLSCYPDLLASANLPK
ncbi:hypothetical protein [Pseudomonas sp. W2-17]|uniref:hypothetical protein n=1 Tax=Pseudomonas sp. W2-17 TaxID=3058039 RepID=UPI0034E0BEC1